MRPLGRAAVILERVEAHLAHCINMGAAFMRRNLDERRGLVMQRLSRSRAV
jgi:hypothetical protein